jgi:hypothetical protein
MAKLYTVVFQAWDILPQYIEIHTVDQEALGKTAVLPIPHLPHSSSVSQLSSKKESLERLPAHIRAVLYSATGAPPLVLLKRSVVALSRKSGEGGGRGVLLSSYLLRGCADCDDHSSINPPSAPSPGHFLYLSRN